MQLHRKYGSILAALRRKHVRYVKTQKIHEKESETSLLRRHSPVRDELRFSDLLVSLGSLMPGFRHVNKREVQSFACWLDPRTTVTAFVASIVVHNALVRSQAVLHSLPVASFGILSLRVAWSDRKSCRHYPQTNWWLLHRGCRSH